jgi:tetratricopeptide (TPR) repeat protein/DNA-binding CsgD family transcriptional regulator
MRIFSFVFLYFFFFSVFGQEHITEKISAYGDCLRDEEKCDGLLHDLLESIKKETDAKSKGERFSEVAAKRLEIGLWDSTSIAILNLTAKQFEMSGDRCAVMRAYGRICGIALHTGDFNLADSLSQRSVEISTHCNDTAIVTRAYSYRVGYFVFTEDYEKALLLAQDEERMAVAAKDSIGMGRVFQEKATIYRSLRQHRDALEYCRKAYNMFSLTGNSENLKRAALELGVNYSVLNEPDSVMKYGLLGKEYFQGNVYFEAIADHVLGSAYRGKGDLTKALFHQENSLNTMIQMGDVRSLVDIYAEISRIYADQNNHTKAYEYALKVREEAENAGDASLIIEGERRISFTAFALGRYEESRDAYERFIAINDSLLNSRRMRDIALLEAEYDAERREQMIQEQTIANAMLTAENRAGRNKMYAMAASLLLLIVGGWALMTRQLAKGRERDAALRVQQMENRLLQTDLDVKNRELTSKALQIAKNNELLGILFDDLNKVQEEAPDDSGVPDVMRKLKIEKQLDDNWEQFMSEFTRLNPNFTRTLLERYPDLSRGELRMASLVKMKMDPKDIAAVLNISSEGVKKARHRLRKKMQLEADSSLETEIEKL